MFGPRSQACNVNRFTSWQKGVNIRDATRSPNMKYKSIWNDAILKMIQITITPANKHKQAYDNFKSEAEPGRKDYNSHGIRQATWLFAADAS